MDWGWWISYCVRKVSVGVALVAASVLIFSASSFASFSLSPSSFSNPGALLDSSVASPIIKTIGLATDHRAFEGAAGLGTDFGFDVSLQAMMVKLPEEFRTALTSAGMGSLPLQIIPVARINAHKGIGERLDLGFSWVMFREIQIVGFDCKVVFIKPEEGPTWAFRLNYTQSKLDFTESGADLAVHTRTFKPELLVSQKLDFAEPYLGIGYELVHGDLSVKIPLPSPLPSIDETVSGHGGGGVAFMGLALRAPGIALRLVIDGEYSTVGAHSLGAKFGFNF